MYCEYGDQDRGADRKNMRTCGERFAFLDEYVRTYSFGNYTNDTVPIWASFSAFLNNIVATGNLRRVSFIT